MMYYSLIDAFQLYESLTLLVASVVLEITRLEVIVVVAHSFQKFYCYLKILR